MTEFNQLLDIQRNMASRLSYEMHMNQTVDLLSLIQQLVTDKLGRVQKELVIVEAMHSGMSEQEVLDLIKELALQRMIVEQGEYLILQ
jgi:hypothetical protein